MFFNFIIVFVECFMETGTFEFEKSFFSNICIEKVFVKEKKFFEQIQF